jgi:hypothetical protein
VGQFDELRPYLRDLFVPPGFLCGVCATKQVLVDQRGGLIGKKRRVADTLPPF